MLLSWPYLLSLDWSCFCRTPIVINLVASTAIDRPMKTKANSLRALGNPTDAQPTGPSLTAFYTQLLEGSKINLQAFHLLFGGKHAQLRIQCGTAHATRRLASAFQENPLEFNTSRLCAYVEPENEQVCSILYTSSSSCQQSDHLYC